MSFECNYSVYFSFLNDEAAEKFYNAYKNLDNLLSVEENNLSLDGNEVSTRIEGNHSDRFVREHFEEALEISKTENDYFDTLSKGWNEFDHEGHIIYGLPDPGIVGEFEWEESSEYSLDDINRYNPDDPEDKFFLKHAKEFFQSIVELSLISGRNLLALKAKYPNIYMVKTPYEMDFALVYQKERSDRQFKQENSLKYIVEYAKEHQIEIAQVDTFIKTKEKLLEPTEHYHECLSPLTEEQEQLHQQFVNQVDSKKLNKSIEVLVDEIKQISKDMTEKYKNDNQKIKFPTSYTIYEDAKAFVDHYEAEELFSLTEWEYEVQSDEILLHEYIGKDSFIVIPGEYRGYHIQFPIKITDKNWEGEYSVKGPVLPEFVDYLFFKEVNGQKVTLDLVGNFDFNDVSIDIDSFYTLKAKGIDISGLNYKINPVTIFSTYSYCSSIDKNLEEGVYGSLSIGKNIYTGNNNEKIGLFSHTSMDKVNISEIKFSKNGSLNSMFAHCQYLKDISSLSNWDMSKVARISHMFLGCSSLRDISPLANWNISNIEDEYNLYHIFDDCCHLTDITPIKDWTVPEDLLLKDICSGSPALITQNIDLPFGLLKYSEAIVIAGYDLPESYQKMEHAVLHYLLEDGLEIIILLNCQLDTHTIVESLKEDGRASCCHSFVQGEDQILATEHFMNDEIKAYKAILDYFEYVSNLYQAINFISSQNHSDILFNFIDWKYERKYNKYYLTEYKGKMERLSIPSQIKGKDVILNAGEYQIVHFSKTVKYISFKSVNGSQVKLSETSFEHVEEVNFDNAYLIDWDTSSWTFRQTKTIKGIPKLRKNVIPRLFDNCKKLKEIENIAEWNVSRATDMKSMFYGCSGLESLDLSGWKLGRTIREAEINDSWEQPLRDIFSGCNFWKLILPNDKASMKVLIKEIQREVNKGSLTIEYLIYQGQEYPLNKEE